MDEQQANKQQQTIMKEERQAISLLTILSRIKQNKSLFIKVTAITAILSAVYIFFIPRKYTSDILLAPELDDISGRSNLSSIASSFGFNVGNSASGDAIYPDLYPQLISTNDFASHLVDYRVTTSDKSISTTYYNYLLHHQKESPWVFPRKILGAVKQLFVKPVPAPAKKEKINLFALTDTETDVLNSITSNINCKTDSKSGIITITVQDQDPLIAATIANAAKDELQNAITRYRTSKAQVDLDYYRNLTAEAKAKYEKARQLYGSYADANTEVILESYKAKQNDLENDMQLKYNTYSTLNTQLQQAIAKVQENTPVFTVIKGATVPLSPSSPKRMLFIIVMIVFAWAGATVYICRKDLATLFEKGF